MARRYVNPNRDPRIRRVSNAEWNRILTSDPASWTLIKTAELEDLLGRAEKARSSAVALSAAEIEALFTGGTR